MAIVDPRQHPSTPSDEAQYIRTLMFTVFSFAVHSVTPILLAFLLLGTHAPPPPQARYIQLQRFDRKGNKLTRAQGLRRLQQRKKLQKVPKKRIGQVVDIAPTPDRTPPENARFLSEHNTRVRKEMLSRYRRLRYQKPTRRASRSSAKKSSRSNPKVAMRSPKQERTLPGGRRNQRKTPKQRRRGLRRPARENQLALPKRGARNKRRKQRGKGSLARERGKGRYKGRQRRLRLAFGDPSQRPSKVNPEQTQQQKGDGQGQGAAKGNGQGSPNIMLKPSFGTLSRMHGAPAPEHIKDMREGEETLLNSRQWLYATFFNRVKRFVSQHWDPAPVYQRRDPYGNIYGVKDRLTVLSIALNPNGTLISAEVHRSCGLAFLDKEAVRAFKAAQPFHNPPKGLRDPDGKIRFRFSFFVYNSHRARFSIFR